MNVGIETYAIGGKMITASMTIDHPSMINVPEVVMKERLAVQLAHAMIENKLIEFTRQEDPQMLGTIIRARTFLTPDTQVRILRINNDKV
jgi:hypothetical protein